jgi:ribonuclease P protein component
VVVWAPPPATANSVKAIESAGTVTASVPEASNQDGKPQNVKRRFPRTSRLLKHADFERVYKQGRRHFSASMTVFYLARPATEGAGGLRVGFTVGRVLGGAVQRNRIKRRLREAVRLNWPAKVPSADVVINPKKSLLTIDFEAVLNEVRRAFVVIEEKLGSR